MSREHLGLPEPPPRIKKAMDLFEIYRKENNVLMVPPKVQQEIWKLVYNPNHGTKTT